MTEPKTEVIVSVTIHVVSWQGL